MRYDGGVATELDDPGLLYRDRKQVPFLKVDEWYKHLGFYRRPDGSSVDTIKVLISKVKARLASLRRLKGASVRGFCNVANVLIGGIL